MIKFMTLTEKFMINLYAANNQMTKTIVFFENINI